jgi:hypothetical protein
MRHNHRWMLALLLLIASFQLAACAQTPAGSEQSEAPARVERLAGTSLNRVILSASANKRLGIQTTQVRDAQVGGKPHKVVPYAALLYDLRGQTWVYTNPAPLTFVRANVTVDSIDGDQVVLSQGPPSGTAVVTVGVPELYGTEFEGGLQP